MLRATALAALAALAACASAPPPPPALAVTNTFPVVYEGRVSPLDAGDIATPGQHDADHAPALEPRRIVAFRATWFELSLGDARALLPALAAAPPPDVEQLPNGATRSWSDDRVATHGPGTAVASTRRTRSIGVAAGHVEPAALDDAIVRLGDRARVLSRQQISVGVGKSGELATLNQTAFVKSLRLAPAADSLLVDDLDVSVFQHGSRLALAAAAHEGMVRVDVEWSETSPVLPIPVATAPMASLQVPVLERHRLTASTTVAGYDALVLGSLPGSARDTVRLLCIEVDPAPRLAAR